MKKKQALAMILLLVSAKSQGKDLFSKEEVAKHAIAADCWMIVESTVYDLTKYLPDHEKYTAVLPEFCGKDATEAWNTKSDRQKPHSKKAEIVLKKYKIGQLKD